VSQPTPEEMTCRELVELVTDYLEGALPDPDRARFDAHLGSCEGCRNYLEQMRIVVRAGGSLSEESLDPAQRETLLEAFRGWSRRRR
jgi:anti-sigma factor RsiW